MKVLGEPEKFNVLVGSRFTLNCTVKLDKYLNLNIMWLVKNKTIDFTNNPRFAKINNSLIIHETVESDSGLYICTASAGMDNASAILKLVVQVQDNML